VVDEKGNPLVVYHGTSEKFKVFDKKKIGENYSYSEGSGFFFTQKKGIAENYAALHTAAKNDSNIHEDNSEGHVMSVYLKIEKPLTRQVNSDFISPADYFDMNKNNLIRFGEIEGDCDGIIIRGTKNDSLYVALKPNQIKSATDNKGTFDDKNKDITKGEE
jgi:hypothetical protein